MITILKFCNPFYFDMSRKPVIDLGEKNTKRVFNVLTLIEVSVMVIIPISLFIINNICGGCLQ